MKLSDFVLSKQWNAGDFDDGSMCGALLYQAPEVLKDGAELKNAIVRREVYWMGSRMAGMYSVGPKWCCCV